MWFDTDTQNGVGEERVKGFVWDVLNEMYNEPDIDELFADCCRNIDILPRHEGMELGSWLWDCGIPYEIERVLDVMVWRCE